VKGNVLVAGAQGALGAVIFWFLGVHPIFMWAVLMALAALVPAIGAALIWAPVSFYLFATGPAWRGLLLIVWGVLVIGLADNVLRPILVGKDSKLPDYVVLVSTLGGLALFGASGLVIGPVIAALFMAAWSIFTEARRQPEGSPMSEG
jgi:predicted PurR-regulated permease PerM